MERVNEIEEEKKQEERGRGGIDESLHNELFSVYNCLHSAADVCGWSDPA